MAGACGRGRAWHCLSSADGSLQVGQEASSGRGSRLSWAPWTAGLGPHMGLGQGWFQGLSATCFLSWVTRRGGALALQFPVVVGEGR